MEISKRDLLKETGISYGQLYRWKREGLIPEEWFLRRSAFTGQETFFPRDKIFPRIHAILELKEQYSLEELAQKFAEDSNPPSAPQKAENIQLTLPPIVQLILQEAHPNGAPYPAALMATALSHLTESFPLSLSDLRALMRSALKMADSFSHETATGMTLTLWRAERPHFLLTLSVENGMVADPRLEKIASVSLSEIASALALQRNPSTNGSSERIL